jgi:hypothetical protein
MLTPLLPRKVYEDQLKLKKAENAEHVRRSQTCLVTK